MIPESYYSLDVYSDYFYTILTLLYYLTIYMYQERWQMCVAFEQVY